MGLKDGFHLASAPFRIADNMDLKDGLDKMIQEEKAECEMKIDHKAKILDLPDKVLLQLFGYLQRKDDIDNGKVGDFRLVCQRFNSLAHDGQFVSRVTMTKFITKHNFPQIKNGIGRRHEKLKFFEYMPHCLSHPRLVPLLFHNVVQNSPNLEQVRTSTIKTDLEGFKALSRCQSIKKLDISFGKDFDDDDLDVSFPPNLTHLQCCGYIFPNKLLTSCKNLHFLTLISFHRKRYPPLDLATVFLNSKETLKSVDLNLLECNNPIFKELCDCPNLESLYLGDYCTVTNFEPITNLSRLTKLEVLNPNRTLIKSSLENLTFLKLEPCYEISLVRFQMIAKFCSQLEEIILKHSGLMRPFVLIEFGQCQKLRKIEFYSINVITEHSVELLINQLGDLEQIKLDRCLTDSEYSSLKVKFPHLFGNKSGSKAIEVTSIVRR